MGQRTPRRRWTPEQRRQAVAEFTASGLTQAEFCRRAGLSAATFSAWCRKHTRKDDASTAGFARVQVSSAATMARAGAAIVVQLEAGLAVSVPVGTDAEWLARVVQALRRR